MKLYIRASLLALFTITLISCDKEIIHTSTEEKDTSCVPQSEIPLGDSLFNRSTYQGDQQFGIATAIRDSLEWEASSKAFFDPEFGTSVFISTVFSKEEELRLYDCLAINFDSKGECFDSNNDSDFRVRYSIKDMDVTLDNYDLMMNANNVVEVIQLDTIQKMVEGKFMLTFLRVKSNRLQEGPDTLRFHNGYFKCQIVD